jgi:hypothetical protein
MAVAPSIASSAPVVWYLDGVTFDDGATAIGSFTYDADGGGPYGTYANAAVEVIETNGDSFLYETVTAGGNFHEISFGGFPGTRGLFFDVLPLFIAPGVSDFDPYFSMEYLNLVTGTFYRHITSGLLTTTAPVATPEPSVAWLLFIVLVFVSRRSAIQRLSTMRGSHKYRGPIS